jgi:hypothetical protein
MLWTSKPGKLASKHDVYTPVKKELGHVRSVHQDHRRNCFGLMAFGAIAVMLDPQPHLGVHVETKANRALPAK